MNKVHVTASRSYDVCIGQDLLSQIGPMARKLSKASKAAIISDSNVWPLHGKAVADSLESAGFELVSFAFPAGEQSKNGQIYLEILNFLAEHQLTRSDLLIALGGGVVGDMTGFVAATYLRGVSFIQVPTSLLAMVDSSVGGKTAIDLPAGKNLCGAFWQPCLVLCDTDALSTLPPEVFRDGCAEVIKYGILYDVPLFEHLETQGLAFDRETVITRCVELKRDVVAQDEFDTGARMKLNLGHTLGHAIEKNSNFRVSHGQAVAMGMAIVTRAAAPHLADRVIRCLTKFQLPVASDVPPADLAQAALSDKKRSGGTVNLILPRAIGHCDIVPTPVEQLRAICECCASL